MTDWAQQAEAMRGKPITQPRQNTYDANLKVVTADEDQLFKNLKPQKVSPTPSPEEMRKQVEEAQRKRTEKEPKKEAGGEDGEIPTKDAEKKDPDSKKKPDYEKQEREDRRWLDDPDEEEAKDGEIPAKDASYTQAEAVMNAAYAAQEAEETEGYKGGVRHGSGNRPKKSAEGAEDTNETGHQPHVQGIHWGKEPVRITKVREEAEKKDPDEYHPIHNPNGKK